MKSIFYTKSFVGNMNKHMNENLLQLKALVDLLNDPITEETLQQATSNIHLFLGFKPLPKSVTGWSVPNNYFLVDTIGLDSGYEVFRPSMKEVVNIKNRLLGLLNDPPLGQAPLVSHNIMPNQILGTVGPASECCAYHLLKLFSDGYRSIIDKCSTERKQGPRKGRCGRYFLRIGKRNHCDDEACTKLDSQQKWRFSRNNRIKESNAAKKRYKLRKGSNATKKGYKSRNTKRRSLRKRRKLIKTNRRKVLR